MTALMSRLHLSRSPRAVSRFFSFFSPTFPAAGDRDVVTGKGIKRARVRTDDGDELMNVIIACIGDNVGQHSVVLAVCSLC